MPDSILPSDITDPDKIFPAKPISSQDQKLPTGEQSFSSYMKGAKPEEKGGSPHVSPLTMMQGSSIPTTVPHPDTLLHQVNKLQETSSQLQEHLGTPNLKLKASTKYLLKNKFTEANENLQGVNTKIGAQAPGETPHMGGPFGKFLGLLNSGQAMMGAAKEQLEKIKSSGSTMQPSDFLLVQLKMNKAQQLLEFSSVLLSNAVSDVKQLMQVQL